MMRRPYLSVLIISIAVALLYGWFLNSQIVFDDHMFFSSSVVAKRFLSPGLGIRTLAYATLAYTLKWFGTGLVGFRLVSMLFHAAVAVSLFFFLRLIQKELPGDQSVSSKLALLAALSFALHPAAVYAAAYLFQRTTVMATLFALLSWTSVLRWLQTRRSGWLWASVGMYAMALLSKEHAVMVPAVSAAIAVWWCRTQSNGADGSALLRTALPAVAVCFAMAVLAVLQKQGVVGIAYEVDASSVLDSLSIKHAWFFSALTQGFLFFKYLCLWLIPNPLWMSVDMREPLATSFMSWPKMLGMIAFLGWATISGWLLWKGGRRGLVGLAMAAPWLLFATEFTTARVQEVFVLYRSYLWLAPAFIVFTPLDRILGRRAILVLTVIVPLALFPLAWNRLTTFSHPLLLWDDAARLVEGKEGVTGLERIYRNRGLEWAKLGKFDLAVEDYTRAIQYRPSFSYAYNSRGAAYLSMKRYTEALADFDAAIRLNPKYPNSHAGRAEVLEDMGRADEAKISYLKACELGWRPACAKAGSIN